DFEVDSGEIVGFLGPNGAGKTTTMRILTAFIPPSSGSAIVGGYDVVSNPLDVRRLIGYLPEQVPLYTELRVREYLKFRAEIKGVGGKDLNKNIDRVIEECQLKDVERKVIAHLSKGYRQRTGLADALVSQPPILILDEPTIGLDPSQIRQTRELIRGLGEKRTLILSTHILPEVEAVCNRVLIIDRGKIVGEGTPEKLRRRLTGRAVIKAVIRGGDVKEDRILTIDGVNSAEHHRDGELAMFTITTDRPQGEVEEKIFSACVDNGWVLRLLEREAPSLEDVFVELVGREEKPEKMQEPEKEEAS
ncbi:MAG: ATP-binding cassette domain-containing protein, partial [Pseudomonadota bacterium]